MQFCMKFEKWINQPKKTTQTNPKPHIQWSMQCTKVYTIQATYLFHKVCLRVRIRTRRLPISGRKKEGRGRCISQPNLKSLINGEPLISVQVKCNLNKRERKIWWADHSPTSFPKKGFGFEKCIRFDKCINKRKNSFIRKSRGHTELVS